jgi:biotin carboxyl carrier protein
MRSFKVTVDGNVYNVTVEETGSAPQITPVSTKSTAPSIKEEAPAPKPAAKIEGGTQIKAPMPGMVLDFKAKEGADVKKGEVILVLEAMKLENDISAPCDGKIRFVAAKGASVNTGDVLAVIS